MPMTTATREPVLTGGCQCGAVRYALYVEPQHASICHCRMCQKAVGNYFAAYAGVQKPRLRLDARQARRLSQLGGDRARLLPRLWYAADLPPARQGTVSVSVGSLDHPEHVHPDHQYGVEGRLPDFERLSSLPRTATQDWAGDRLAKLASRQHPDHETKDWKPHT